MAPGPPATTVDEYNCDCERLAYCTSIERGNKYADAYFRNHRELDNFKWRMDVDSRPDFMGQSHVGDDELWKELPYWCSADVLKAIAPFSKPLA